MTRTARATNQPADIEGAISRYCLAREGMFDRDSITRLVAIEIATVLKNQNIDLNQFRLSFDYQLNKENTDVHAIVAEQ
jgi:hypothetical protein